MTQNKGDVVFRRIHGRIVPIRRAAGQARGLSPERKKEAAKGVAIAAAGVGASFGGGLVFRKSLKSIKKTIGALESAYARNAAILKKMGPGGAQGSLFAHAGIPRQEFVGAAKTDKLFRSAKNLGKFSTALKWAAPLAGAGLIAYGANRFSKATTKNRKGLNKTALLGAAGSVGGASFVYGSQGRAGIKNAFMNHALPRIKGFFKATSLL
jgi:hypothetical protein